MREVLEQVTASTRQVCDALDGADLLAPSLLPGWSRLTIACHLRYGAEAIRQMTLDALAGRPAAYYPGGRATQRPGTLEPRPGERAADVVTSLRETSAALDDVWSAVDDWSIVVREPEDNVDIGSQPLGYLPLVRLTEVEVHGTDLDLGLSGWSELLIREGLWMRLDRVARRTPLAPGAWSLNGFVVGDGSEPEVIEASDRQLFALTLGRIHLSDSFAAAYPGP